MSIYKNLLPIMLPQNKPPDCDKYDVLRDKINELIETIELCQMRITFLEEKGE